MATVRRPRLAEVVCVATAVLLLGALEFAPYARRGGFLYDDWARAATMRFHGFGGLARLYFDTTPRRPLAGVYFAGVHALLGEHEHWHLALAALLHLAAGALLYAVLRTLEAGILQAGAVALLFLLFPYADSTWLWATGGQHSTAIGLWLAGVLLALHGLRRPGVGLHLLALVCFAASILLYEDTLVVVLLTGVLYLRRAPRRVALARWGADVVTVAVCVVLFTSQLVRLGGTDVHAASFAAGDVRGHVRVIAAEGWRLAVASLEPYGAPSRWLVTIAVGVLLVAAVAAARSTRDGALRRRLGVAAAFVVGGSVVAAGGWSVLAIADPYYVPLQPGIGNRINVVASIGIALISVGVFGIVAALAAAALPRLGRWVGPALLIAGTGAIIAAYASDLARDRQAWRLSRRQQGVVLARLRAAVPRPPQNTTVIVQTSTLAIAPGVPVFDASWDLNGAAQLMWGSPSIRAWPAPHGAVACARDGMSVPGIGPLGPPAGYGSTIIVDIERQTAARAGSVGACLRLTRGA